MPPRSSILTVFLPLLFASVVLGQDVSPAESEKPEAETEVVSATDPEAESDRIDALITGLESPNFATRQKATADLLKLDAIGTGVLDQKSRTMTTPSRTTVLEILGRLRKRLFDDRLTQFNSHPTEESAKELPDWNRFAELAGTDEKAVEVYRQLLTAERELFSLRMFASPELPSAMEARSIEFSKRCTGRRDDEFPTASCAALMLLGSDPAVDLPRLTSTKISDAFGDDRFAELIDDGVYSEPLRKLAGAWMNRTGKNGRPAIAVDRPLLFSISHDLPDGRKLALKVIETGGRFQTMYYSLLTLAHFQNKDDLKVVEPLLTSTTVLWPVGNQTAKQFSDEFQSTYTVQVRDVALVVSAHLRGRNPADFGSSARPSAQTVFDVYSLGFDTDEARLAAIKAYQAAYPQ